MSIGGAVLLLLLLCPSIAEADDASDGSADVKVNADSGGANVQLNDQSVSKGGPATTQSGRTGARGQAPRNNGSAEGAARTTVTDQQAPTVEYEEKAGPAFGGAACEIAIREDAGGDCTVPPEQPEAEEAAEPAEALEPAPGPELEPQVDPAIAALSLIADIKFSGGAPQIGPPANINPWGIAVVGYPYWFWTDGPTSLQASQNSLGIEVSLDATATSVTFDTGDGGTVICNPSSAPRWSEGVAPKQESPSCGYTWTERSATPSSPKSAHTVTATTTWEVNWTAGGESGTEVVQRSESVDVVVGELQALVTS